MASTEQASVQLQTTCKRECIHLAVSPQNQDARGFSLARGELEQSRPLKQGKEGRVGGGGPEGERFALVT